MKKDDTNKPGSGKDAKIKKLEEQAYTPEDLSLADELEFIGQLQSIVMDIIAYHTEFEKLSQQQIYDIVLKYVSCETQAPLHLPDASKIYNEVKTVFGKDAEGIVKHYMEAGCLEKKQARDVLGILEGLDETDIEPDEFIWEADRREQEVEANRDYNDGEKEIVIGVSITSKHLYTYWWDASHNPQHPFMVWADNFQPAQELSPILRAGIAGFLSASQGQAARLEAGVAGAAIFVLFTYIYQSAR